MWRGLGNGSVDWDNLRVFLMVARCGSFQAASRRLKMDATTVARRVARLEDVFGATLFSRSAHTLHLTDRASALFDIAQKMEAELEQIDASEPLAAAGTVRISAAEGFSAGRCGRRSVGRVGSGDGRSLPQQA